MSDHLSEALSDCLSLNRPLYISLHRSVLDLSLTILMSAATSGRMLFVQIKDAKISLKT